MAAGEDRNVAGRRTNEVDATGRTVARNIARLRNIRGMSTYRLAEVLEGLGRPVAPSQISRIESSKRKVDVDDLMAFAVALNVSPAALLLEPVADFDATMHVTAAGGVGADLAWSWMLGERPLSLPEHDDGEAWNDFQTYSRPPGRRQYATTPPPPGAVPGDSFKGGRVIRRGGSAG